MQDTPAAPKTGRRKRSTGPLARFWRRIRKPLAESRVVKNALASALAGFIRFVRWTNPVAEGSADQDAMYSRHKTAIYALWHGQHVMGPVFNPSWHKLIVMVSKSADAEINALVAEKLGLETVRGSGGREGGRSQEKGGARALIALKKALDQGTSVCMIADIPHGTPRQAGLGVITLARISGRPIVGLAIATSRRKVLESTWDKTTINLPFGRSAFTASEPIFVPADASEADMERFRVELTTALNRATDEAYRLVDRKP
ncbi:MAG: lysophospholipid acyltransferase family protein [Mesorhizobium sp.]|nr:lysophospholipid acyltransferase family protein [Mesorhizobium sp.]